MVRAHTANIARLLAQAEPSDISYGRHWYRQAFRDCQAIATRCGLPGFVVAGVVAALSPRCKWSRNLTDAESLCLAYVGRSDTSVGSLKVCTFGTMKAKAVAILSLPAPTIESVSAILNGQKIKAFYLCILGHDSVCVDGHAYAVWMGKRIPVTETPNISASLYEIISRAYRLVAKRSESICGVQLSAAQVQAITWVTYRRIHGING